MVRVGDDHRTDDELIEQANGRLRERGYSTEEANVRKHPVGAHLDGSLVYQAVTDTAYFVWHTVEKYPTATARRQEVQHEREQAPD